MYENFFSIYGVHSPRKSLNLCVFTHAPVPYPKLLVESFKNLFPSRPKGWRKLRNYADDLEHYFISIWYGCNFSKCDGFKIL